MSSWTHSLSRWFGFRRPQTYALATNRCRLAVEQLEDRLAPAIFTGAGPNLAIDLNTANEIATFSTNGTTVTVNLTNGTANTAATAGSVTGNGTAIATFLSSVYTGTITITDSAAGTSVAFANSTGNYAQVFGITLNDAASGNVTFTGNSTFTDPVTAATNAGFFASDAASSLTLLGGGSNLSLTATGHDILLEGAVTVRGVTVLSGNVIQADNAANDFVSDVTIAGSPFVISINDINDLTLATSASFLNTGALNQTSRITAGENLEQSGPLTITGTTGGVNFTSTGASISLIEANIISANVALGFSATGGNTATVFNTLALTLGNVTLGTGQLAVTARDTISQTDGTTIQTGGAVALTIDTGTNKNILLGNAGNRIAGAVTVAEANGGDIANITLRNAADNAAAPTGAPLTAVLDVRNLELFFDNNGVALPGYSITGNLTVTAGGDVTQTAALTVLEGTTITVLGDFGIALTKAANNFSNSGIRLNATQSTQAVQVVNGFILVLSGSDLGRGTFSATAVTGNIVAASRITQRKGAGPAVFTVTAGTSVALTGPNDFAGSVVFAGAGLTAVNIRNASFQAKFSDLTIPSTVNNLTVEFDNAAAVLPSLSAANLTVTALGIVQQPGSTLTLTGDGDFNAGPYILNLGNAGNDFKNLRLTNSGRNDVTVVETNNLTFSATGSDLGTGRLNVTAGGTIAGGPITQNATGPAGDVSFVSTGGGVTLTGVNIFRGSVSVSVAGANAVSVTNTGVALTLGSVTTVSGAFTAAAGAEGIRQDPNSVLNLGGTSQSFTAAGGAITLTNRTNTLLGAIGLTATNASIRATGAITLAASTVTGVLNLKTDGVVFNPILQTGAITGNSVATFDAGTANVILTDAANNFASVSVFSTGTIVSIRDANALNVDTIRLGEGTLTLTTGGSINLVSGQTSSIVQIAGGGAITLDTPAGSNISLNSAANVLRGTVNVVHATNVNVETAGDLTFTAGSTITGFFNARAGGVLTLPANLTSLASLDAFAATTTIGSDITTAAGGNISFTGAVVFTGNRTLSSGFHVTIEGEVTAEGTLTLTLAPNRLVQFNGGVWNQGAHGLTVNGVNTKFLIGDNGGRPARLIMTGGTIAMPDNSSVIVSLDSTFQIGAGAGSAETVTLANGSGGLTINGTLAVGFGATNDRLIKTGSGAVTLGAASQLGGSGLAGPTASPVLTSQTSLLTGRFANSVDAADNPRDFFAGSDIVTPAYDFTQVTVKAGGLAAPFGTVTGFLPDGDKYTVTSSIGAAAGLVTVEDLSGRLDIVVRNTTSAAASTLTISAFGGGDGQLLVGGVMVHTPGAVSVSAPAANFIGLFTTAGRLTSLTSRDIGTETLPFILTAGGAASGTTSILARVVRNGTLTLAGTLSSFKAVSAFGVNLTALKYGTLTTTGNAAAQDRGDFGANLTSTTAANGIVLNSATIAGQLSGLWDLRGSVGTVKAARTFAWVFGFPAAATLRNGGLLTNVTSLDLGVVAGTQMHVTGAVASLTTAGVFTSLFVAGSYGKVLVKVQSNPALDGIDLAGRFFNSTLMATGNAAGVALNSLSIAGDLESSTLSFLNGDVNSISVARTVGNSAIGATDTGTRGNLKSITAGRWNISDVDARSIGSLTIKGNLSAGLFGDFTEATVTVRGNAAGVGLGTFSAQGNVSSSTFDVQNGNLTSFKVGRQIGFATVHLTDAAFGNLGLIQAGDWTVGVNVLAKTIGTVASVGAAALNPASLPLLGAFVEDTITAYRNAGTGAAIGKLIAKGEFIESTANAERGITTVTIGRNVVESFIVADDALGGALNVGRITTLTAGDWEESVVTVNTFGTVKITGFARPESNSASFQFGDVEDATFQANGATPLKPVGIASFTVARNFESDSFLKAPFGITTLTVGGTVDGSIVTDNPVTPTAGFLTTFTAGQINNSTVRAGSIGTLKTTGSIAFGLRGDFTDSTVAVNSTAATLAGPRAISTLTVAGDFINSTLDAPGTVGAISVAGRVNANFNVTRVLAGYAPGSKLGALTAGAWSQSDPEFTADLTSQQVGTFTLKGNAARGFVGTADGAFIDILGPAAGVGLGSFSATGAVSNSLFRVSEGDVTSFSVLRFLSSDLLVGYRFVKASDITQAPAAANWSALNRKIVTFKTTAPFSAADPLDSASFADSNVVAAILGNITLAGVNPAANDSTAFGAAFRTSAGAAAKGIVKTNGSAVALMPPATNGKFNYLGLSG